VAEVVGRDDELASILAFLDDGASSAILLEGEAGIGKTTLWRAGVEAARDRGHTVLSCNPSGSETHFSLSALRDLLDDDFDALADGLPEPQQRALRVALLRSEPEEAAPQPSAVAASFLNALRALAGRGPVLVAVDDVQWLDSPSAEVIEYAARRLRGDPIRLLLSARTEGVAKVKYTAAGIACPAQVDATASLTGKGIAGKASVKVAAGKTTTIAIPVKAKAGTTGPATFKIVLKTNGRTTTETCKVRVVVTK